MRFIVIAAFLFSVVSAQAAINGWALIDFSGASSGDKATTNNLTASVKGLSLHVRMTHGTGDADGSGEFAGNHPQMVITNAAARALDGGVTINGTNYTGNSTVGMRVLEFSSTNVCLLFTIVPSNGCFGMYYRYNNPGSDSSSQRDLVLFQKAGVGGSEYFCVEPDTTPRFFSHQASSDTLYGTKQGFTEGKWYWVTGVQTGPSALWRVQFYDPDSNYSLVSESSHTANANAEPTKAYFGMHKYSASGGTQWSHDYANIIIANTNQFPMIPSIPASATNWVSTSGIASWANANSVDELAGTNCASLATMNANAAAGDLVYFRAGNYTSQINLTASGTVTDRISLRAYNSEVVAFSNITDYAIELIDNDYVTVDGFKILDCNRFILWEGCFGNIATNINGSDCKVQIGTFVNAFRIWSNSQSNVVVDSVFKRVGWTNGFDDESRVILVGESTDPSVDFSSHNLFLRCTIAQGGHDTMSVFSSFNRIQDCHFYNDVWYPTGTPVYGNRNLMLNGVGSSASGRNVIDGCTFFRAAPPPDAVGVSSVSVRAWGNIVRRSVFVDGADSGINLNRFSEHDAYSPQGLVSFNHVFHNTVVYNGTNTGNLDNDQTAGITLTDFSDGSPAIATNIFKNIILWDNVDDRGFAFEGVTSNANGHVFLGNRNESSDPLFVDWSTADLDPDNPNAHDFNLTSSSTSIDAGAWLTTITTSTGSGTSFVVADSGYFTDGEGIYAGDTIQLQGQSTTLTISDVNYSTHTITFSPSASWTIGDGVALPYNGSAPDQGAFEVPAGVMSVIIGTRSLTPRFNR